VSARLAGVCLHGMRGLKLAEKINFLEAQKAMVAYAPVLAVKLLTTRILFILQFFDHNANQKLCTSFGEGETRDFTTHTHLVDPLAINIPVL
jgi:hypothetical protein